MPRTSFLVFLAGVATLFAAVGTVNDGLNLQDSTPARWTAGVLTTAGFALLWAWLGTLRRKRAMVLLAICQALTMWLISRFAPPQTRTLTAAEWQSGTIHHDLAILILVILGYTLFAGFFQREGMRFFAAHNEIELASAIQRRLVPTIATTMGEFEIYGASVPSGAVGGDLIDAVENGDTVCAYLADVAGHGVPAGVLMSMIKAAARTQLATPGLRADDFLSGLNNVLKPLTDSASYATFAFVLVKQAEDQVSFSLAAHLPLFHLQHKAGRVGQCTVENLPLAMFDGTNFKTATLTLGRGDLLAMVTDGLTEVENSQGQELGSTYIEQNLVELGGRPLEEIGAKIFQIAAAYGKQTDDRTLLLLRRKWRIAEHTPQRKHM